MSLFWIEHQALRRCVSLLKCQKARRVVSSRYNQTLGDSFCGIWYSGLYYEPTWAKIWRIVRKLSISFEPRALWNKHFNQLCKLISEQMLMSKRAVGKECRLQYSSCRVISSVTALVLVKLESYSGTKQTCLYRSSDILDNYSAWTSEEHFSDRIYDKLRRGWA